MIFNNCKITELKELHDQKILKLNKIQKPVPNTSADLCSIMNNNIYSHYVKTCPIKSLKKAKFFPFVPGGLPETVENAL